MTRSANRLTRHRWLQEGYAVVEIIQCDELAIPLRPFPHPAVAAMPPGQHFDSPLAPVHTLQVSVKADAVDKAASVSGQQYRDTGIPVVVEGITQHRGLQGLIYPLLPALHRAAFQQLYRHSFVFETVPDVSQLGRNGADGDCVLNLTSGVRQFQEIPEMDTHPMTGDCSFSFYSDVSSADEDVGVVPVDKDFFHCRTVEPALLRPIVVLSLTQSVRGRERIRGGRRVRRRSRAGSRRSRASADRRG